MAVLGEYTTTQAIRACLAVDESDIPDTYILESNMQIELELHLDEWLPDHAAIVVGDDRSARLLKMFSQWYCGHLLTQRQLAMIQEFTDGKTRLKRFDVNLDSLAAKTLSQVEYYKKLLMKERGIPDSSVNNFSFIAISTPTTDPVTSTE